MTLTDVSTARTALEQAARDFDPATHSGSDAVAMLTQLGRIRRLTDGMIGKAAKRVDDTASHRRGTDRNAAELCARLVGISTGEARRAIETAAKLESLFATDAAVRAGTLSARHAEMIANEAAEDPTVEPELLEASARGTVPLRDACIAARARREDPHERMKRQHRARSLKTWTGDDGMFEGRFRLSPEVGGAVKSYLEMLTRRRFRAARGDGTREPHDRYAADALVEAILGDGGEAKAGGGYTVHVVIDHDALVRGEALEGETCEIPGVGPVNVGWVHSLLGTAFVTAIVKKGKDITTVAHLGRHIPAELRTALSVSGRECCIEGCHGREYLEVDHSEVDHAKGGPTAWWNLRWICYLHHKLKSRGWTLGPPDPVTGKRRLEPPTTAKRAA